MMRSILREKARGLSLLSFLKLPVSLLIILSILLPGCGPNADTSDAIGAPSGVSSPQGATTVEAAPAKDSDTKKAFDPVKGGNGAKTDAHLSDGIVPTKIQIPSLSIKADIIALGLTKDGAMDVPKDDDDVGWFAPGYRPGTPGHAVLAGHVDSKTGPAVFYKLNRLSKGDEIILTDADGSELKFKVIATAKYPYDDAPLKEIFGPSKSVRLNVITCTGAYSRSKGTHQERLVVTAELIAS